MFRVDLHTHSIVSHDGGIGLEYYKKIIADKDLDYIAITDHNEVSVALNLKETLGEKIIVGEEILTTEGEIIGLYLNQRIEPGLSAAATVKKIHEQDGLVYIPHPFETLRKGLSKETINSLLSEIDIIETFNARGRFRNHSVEAKQFQKAGLVGASSSDAHCRFGVGTAYSKVVEIPTRDNLQQLLLNAEYQEKYSPILTYLCPTINRIKKHVL